MQPFHAFLFTPGEVEDEQLLSAPCAAMEGQKQGGNTNYASSSTASNHALRNSHSCECIGPLRVSSQSEHNLRNSAPPSRQQLCEHANIRVCFYLCLFLLLCKVRANRVCPLSPSGSHRLNNLSMLAWSTHCDEERVRAKGLSRSPFTVALHRQRPAVRSLLQWSEAGGSVGADVTSGLSHFRVRLSPVRCCSEASVATRVAESFITFYLVPKFDKISFTFHLEWQDCMWLCLHWCLHYLLYRCHPKAEKYLKKHN